MPKNKSEENYLENKPIRNPDISWKTEENGLVTLSVENKGAFNKIAQKLFKKPRYTQIHLDENGSFVWPLIDGEKSILDIGLLVKEHFGEACEPLYQRLSKYFEILKSYNFIYYK